MDAAALRSEKGILDEDADFDLDIRMMRFEQLMDRRPFLVNDVLLRQNPNNVIEWEKGLPVGRQQNRGCPDLHGCHRRSPTTKAIGKFHELWVNYAKFYENAGDLRTANIIMEKAVKVPFKSVAELAEMWCEWAEMELRNENFDKAVNIMAKATQAPKRSTVDYFDETATTTARSQELEVVELLCRSRRERQHSGRHEESLREDIRAAYRHSSDRGQLRESS
jgi:pre-mRNA-splicing factor SYF1